MTPIHSLRFWIGLPLALFILNFLLTFHNVWPTPWIRYPNELSIELAILVLLLAGYAEWVRLPGKTALFWFTLLLLILVLGRYADVTSPALYGRPINLYWDARHLPNVAAMLITVASPWLVLVIITATVLLLGGLFGLLRGCVGILWNGFEPTLTRRLLAAAAAGVIALFAVGKASQKLATEYWFSLPVSPVYTGQISFALEAMLGAGRHLPPSPPLDSDLGRLQGEDVLIIFIESYGATVFNNPIFAERLAPSYEQLGSAIEETGRGVASAFVTSPTFGGSSWLAHSSLLSGIELHNEGHYQLLLASERETLVSLFKRQGYRTIGLMPGLQKAWPEGAFYGFDQIYNEASLDYQGPAFGWWHIPDQYSLAKLHELELKNQDRAPVLALFPTTASHIPFLPVPAYQPDWAQVLTSEPFPPEALQDSLAKRPEWFKLGDAYVTAIDYELTWLTGYLGEWAPEDALFVVLGDHQPSANVSGDRASWDVPVHVISHNSAVLNALVEVVLRPD
ncbi:MAG: sulfatase-like hydrolase/transferase [Candidatus Competibacteraceae bacterium]|nr:sulfatase-like hydrolase/transferase [Candidatus Competibacteraceae bacterium]